MSATSAESFDTGARKGSCAACPFNDGLTEEACVAQNYGCLPTAQDIVELKRRSGQNWACHDDETRVCAGLCHAAREHGLDLSQGGLVRYSSWYRAGSAAAEHEARTGVLVEKLTGAQFDSAVYGSRDARPWLAVPKLKYYIPPSSFRQADTRVFWVASCASDSPHGPRHCAGLLEVETSPYDAHDLWLLYVSVAPEHQRQGIAARMLEGLIEHVRSTGQRLVLSRFTDEGKAKLKPSLLRRLQAGGIEWSAKDD